MRRVFWNGFQTTCGLITRLNAVWYRSGWCPSSSLGSVHSCAQVSSRNNLNTHKDSFSGGLMTRANSSWVTPGTAGLFLMISTSAWQLSLVTWLRGWRWIYVQPTSSTLNHYIALVRLSVVGRVSYTGGDWCQGTMRPLPTNWNRMCTSSTILMTGNTDYLTFTS